MTLNGPRPPDIFQLYLAPHIFHLSHLRSYTAAPGFVGAGMRRREVIVSLAGAAAWPRYVDIVYATTKREVDTAFSTLSDNHTEGLAIHTNALFNDRRIQLVTLAAHHRIPTIYPWREAPEVGGLIFYGTSGTDEYRQVGIYVGRVLQGEKPADLPIMRAVKFELVINLQTARTLGIEVPPSLLAVADDVIE
jgi:ABC-type uncharacterized transport system substrate-binding protein